jgi:hypothetical protein
MTNVFHRTDAGILRKYKAFGIQMDALQRYEDIIVVYKQTKLRAKSSDIIAYGLDNTGMHRDATKLKHQVSLEYFYPLHLWEVIAGDSMWWTTVYNAHNWKLPKEQTCQV